MGMQLHELHPSLIHLPLGLLPMAAGVDLAAALSSNDALDRTGRMLWGAGTIGGLLAGVAGLAATQEVKVTDKHVSDAMLLHGVGNTVITLGAIALTSWRRRHAPSVASAIVGLGAVGAALFTAYLGGELVYARGVGVKRMAAAQGEGVVDNTDLFSRQAPRKFLRDVAGGLGWALRESKKYLTGQERFDRRALTIG
jgi:uncharacterized membrane protein